MLIGNRVAVGEGVGETVVGSLLSTAPGEGAAGSWLTTALGEGGTEIWGDAVIGRGRDGVTGSWLTTAPGSREQAARVSSRIRIPVRYERVNFISLYN